MTQKSQPHIAAMRLFVKKILEKPLDHEWTVQGLGMYRMYLSDEVRLHIWLPEARTPNVSDIHNHPWGFGSTVIVGAMHNHRYWRFHHWRNLPEDADTFVANESKIECGSGGGLIGEPSQVRLWRRPIEHYPEGKTYYQDADEIHSSHPEPATVTLCVRTFGTDPDHAHVYWPAGESWVSAEPRPATNGEVWRMADEVHYRRFEQ